MKTLKRTISLLIFLGISVSNSFLVAQENGLVENRSGKYHTKPFYQPKNDCADPVVVDSFPSGLERTAVIAFDGEHIWVTGGQTFVINKLSIVDGTILHSIPIEYSFVNGLTFANGHLWLNDSENDVIHKIDTASGQS
ncbi:MAG: hypothetical protein MK086_14770, partial [Flavobacteriales bacterium]|nr:hypothetical protein [Flavobacteriales bacterium]